MSYLENKLCKFTPLFDINYNKKVNMLSACFFIMENRGYKELNKYTNGLKKINEQITKRKLDYKLRLFIDDSVYSNKDLFNQISKLENIQLVLYSCPNFIIRNNYHIGLFGTLVRFFPFFDFANNDANIVISSDIDDTNLSSIFNYIKKLSSHINLSEIYLLKSGELNRSLKYRFDFMYKNKLNPYVYALSYASFKRIDHNVIVDYLKHVNADRGNKAYSFHYVVENANDIGKGEPNNPNKYGDELGSFIYGVDEYFLNHVLAQYLIDNKLCNVVRTNWDIFGPLYYVLMLEKGLTDKEINLINLIFQYVYKEAGFELNNKMNISDKFNNLDEKIFIPKYSDNLKNNNEKDKIRYKLNKIFYKMFLYLKSNPNYKFIYPKEFYDLFVDDDRYFGTYKIDFFRIINCGNKDRDIVISQEKFKLNDVNKLKKFYSSLK